MNLKTCQSFILFLYLLFSESRLTRQGKITRTPETYDIGESSEGEESRES